MLKFYIRQSFALLAVLTGLFSVSCRNSLEPETSSFTIVIRESFAEGGYYIIHSKSADIIYNSGSFSGGKTISINELPDDNYSVTVFSELRKGTETVKRVFTVNDLAGGIMELAGDIEKFSGKLNIDVGFPENYYDEIILTTSGSFSRQRTQGVNDSHLFENVILQNTNFDNSISIYAAAVNDSGGMSYCGWLLNRPVYEGGSSTKIINLEIPLSRYSINSTQVCSEIDLEVFYGVNNDKLKIYQNEFSPSLEIRFYVPKSLTVKKYKTTVKHSYQNYRYEYKLFTMLLPDFLNIPQIGINAQVKADAVDSIRISGSANTIFTKWVSDEAQWMIFNNNSSENRLPEFNSLPEAFSKIHEGLKPYSAGVVKLSDSESYLETAGKIAGNKEDDYQNSGSLFISEILF